MTETGYPVVWALTTARSGTTFLCSRIRAEFGEAVRADHEALQHGARLRHFFRCFDPELQKEAWRDKTLNDYLEGIERTSRSRPVLIFGNTLSHLAPLLAERIGDQLRLLHLHRNPILACASITVGSRPEWWDIGEYGENPYEIRISPFDPNAVFVEYRERWARLSPFEKTLYQWLERHAFALEMKERFNNLPYLTIRAEDMFDNDEPYEALLTFSGLDRFERTLRESIHRKNERWQRSVEKNPLGESWRRYKSHPHVLELARELGHNLDPEYLQREIARYQLPPGIGPWVRYKTRYWNRRARLGAFLRERNVLPPQPDDTAGLPPRSLLSLVKTILRSHRWGRSR